ncbi:MAG: HAMP domain-containing histidine kinase [Chloroflexi bacterium]|nr:HAMP domain-containing histidine kinase [Chloroflexota bacterium]
MTRLRVRLAATFALVALLTGFAVALTAPSIIGTGFARMQREGQGAGPPGGPGPGQGAGQPGHAAVIQQETTQTIVVVALVAAGAASLLGALIAGRIVDPLGRLGVVAQAVAGGDLRRRGGLAERRDEIGELGRSFDSMAAALEAADDSRRRFFQDAAHELKTPLAVIDATATAVLDGGYDHDRKHVATIQGQARVLARIVDDLRTVSLAETGHLPLHLEPVDVEAAVDAAVAAFTARADARGIALRRSGASGRFVRADPERLAQVLGALLDNAVRHTPRGGSVTVAVIDADGTVRIAVADTGPGVDPRDAPHLFDRFYQGDPSRDRATGSSGLGLTIVRALVGALGGRVGVEPTPGGGATFWLELSGATPP